MLLNAEAQCGAGEYSRKANNGKRFKLGLTKEQYKKISKIDSLTSGIIASEVELPDEKQKARLIISGITEEAISSSQMEGASTSREVAKEMIRTQRKPRNNDEQMIFNNYIAMTRVEGWTKRKLSEEFLKEIHKVIAKETMASEECGEFRKDEDDIVINNPVTGKIYHRPKKINKMFLELNDLYEFANTDDEDNYMHPIVKGIILHFWIGYLHPFTDGNGRTARVIFYWYMIKKGYWLFRYIPISTVIKRSKTAYAKAYIETEQIDELDLGYFIQYILIKTLLSIDEFQTYLQRKGQKEENMREALKQFGFLNDRQVGMIHTLKKYNVPIDIATHQRKYNLSYEAQGRILSC